MHEKEVERSLLGRDAHGIVLAMNGSKHWYCMFIPREGRSCQVSNVFSPPPNGAKDDECRYGNGVCGGGTGAFGEATRSDLHSSSASGLANSVIPAPLSASGYGNALTQWVDRVFEGQMPRLYVRQWPGLYLRTSDDEEEEWVEREIFIFFFLVQRDAIYVQLFRSWPLLRSAAQPFAQRCDHCCISRSLPRSGVAREAVRWRIFVSLS